MPEIKINFSIAGSVQQIIHLADDCPFTPEQIVEALNNKGNTTICTTIQEDGDLVWIRADGHFQIIGKLFDVSVDAEYSDFELDTTL